MSVPFPNSGSLFEGQYEIRSQIGSGGFARVYHAIHRNLQRDVALKILKPKPFEDLDAESRDVYDDQFVERFQREARNIAQLRDPHTVTLYDFGRTDGGLFFMVFEYINGEPLSKLARRKPPLAPRRTVKILRGVLSSLHEAHALGILHRDIKPGNIMVYQHVGRSDQVKVLDFGISKAMLGGADLTLRDLTRQNAMVGTPRYVSPEQLRGGEAGPQSDLYSLGLVAFEMTTGELAVDPVGTIDIINRQISPQPIVVPESCRAPRNLRATLQRMLAKDPDERFGSARAVREALEHWDAEYDLEWTPRWLDPPSEPLETRGDADLDELPVGDVADQQYRTDADEELEQVTRPMSHPERSERQDDRNRGSSAERTHRAYELAAVAAVAFVLPVFAYVGLSWWWGADPAPDPENRTRTAGAPSKDAGPSESQGYVTFEVETKPPGAHIKIGHRAVGESPLELRRDHFSFPTSVRAELPDGRRLVRTVDRPGGRIVFDFESARSERRSGGERGAGVDAGGAGGDARRRDTDGGAPETAVDISPRTPNSGASDSATGTSSESDL